MLMIDDEDRGMPGVRQAEAPTVSDQIFNQDVARSDNTRI
jgi:hypothetical protein